MSPVEVQGYGERGDIALDELASSVRLQPERYNQRRILDFTQLPEVKAAMAGWQSSQPIVADGQNTGWHLLKVAAQGEPVVIGGRNVWTLAWQETEQQISVEHPDYPGQIHSLDVYELQTEEQTLMFAAGELSNNVWCFYLPDVY
ncbi:hypothetical protein L2750_02910 [Shewanella submarina]|uniref:Uncharacterized protein n=1 Tax=Shewanella submarina TaxID=2016376 RepID=A0ABV7GJR6_9GAMM|nr:hypothetical protein [Shewanella submarina]MCL1036106.1 hypothetical protein [Shewanella submarina]